MSILLGTRHDNAHETMNYVVPGCGKQYRYTLEQVHCHYFPADQWGLWLIAIQHPALGINTPEEATLCVQ